MPRSRRCQRAVPAGGAEAVGELTAVVGEDGVDGVAEGLEEALQAGGDGLAAALLDDVDVDEAGGAFDGDEDVGGFLVQARQVLEIDMDVAEGLRGEALGGRRGLALSLRDAVALEAAVQGGAGDVGAQAAAHNFQDVVEGERQAGAQFHHSRNVIRNATTSSICSAVRIGLPRHRSPTLVSPSAR